MTACERIEVQTYAGYRGEESPRAFLLMDKEIKVLKVMEQWTEESSESGERYRCFRVKGSDWRVHVLCYDEGKMEWYHRK